MSNFQVSKRTGWIGLAGVVVLILLLVLVFFSRERGHEGMVLIPAGSFQMGSDADTVVAECADKKASIPGEKRSTTEIISAAEGDCRKRLYEDEEPAHTVNLAAFYIDRLEVTNAQYAACVDEGVCDPPSQVVSISGVDYYENPEFDDFPVIWVSWQSAVEYCQWRDARLPTEAEWEKAARGDDSRKYPWGNEDVAGHLLNYADINSLVQWADVTQNDGYWQAAPVGSYLDGASPYGVLDMAGNVWEWVADWYLGSYYSDSPLENPRGPATGEMRVARGGSWIDPDWLVRAAGRFRGRPNGSSFNIGFRCASSS